MVKIGEFLAVLKRLSQEAFARAAEKTFVQARDDGNKNCKDSTGETLVSGSPESV